MKNSKAPFQRSTSHNGYRVGSGGGVKATKKMLLLPKSGRQNPLTTYGDADVGDLPRPVLSTTAWSLISRAIFRDCRTNRRRGLPLELRIGDAAQVSGVDVAQL